MYLQFFQCCQVIGDDNMAADELKRRIKDDDYCILVVTPDIIKNYFLLSREASLSDFTLLIFDETHHAAKKHSYNRILNMYRKAKLERDSSGELSSLCVPQVNNIVSCFIMLKLRYYNLQSIKMTWILLRILLPC